MGFIGCLLLKYRENYAHNWIFVTHEQLSRSPIEEFGKIYDRLGLTFSKQIQKKILKFSFADSSKRNKLRRDSKSNIWTWKKRLTDNEIANVKENTNKIASNFYTEKEWNI